MKSVRYIVRWLNNTNPSLEHNAACQKHEPGTGSWLVSGKTFESWMRSDNSLLWINGGGQYHRRSHPLQHQAVKYANITSAGSGKQFFGKLASKRVNFIYTLTNPTAQALLANFRSIVMGSVIQRLRIGTLHLRTDKSNAFQTF